MLLIGLESSQKSQTPLGHMFWHLLGPKEDHLCTSSSPVEPQRRSFLPASNIKHVQSYTGWCSTLTLLLICSSFSRENGYPLLICSSLSTAQKRHLRKHEFLSKHLTQSSAFSAPFSDRKKLQNLRKRGEPNMPFSSLPNTAWRVLLLPGRFF